MTDQEMMPNEKPKEESGAAGSGEAPVEPMPAAEPTPEAPSPSASSPSSAMPGTPPSGTGATAQPKGSIGGLVGNVMMDTEANEDDRLLAGLAYLSQVILPIIVPAIMLLSETNRQRPFQRYHAIQALGTLGLYIIYEVLAAIVFVILSLITLGCLAFILWVLFFVPIIPAVYYAYLAYQGKRFDIPIVTSFTRQQGWL